MGDLPKTLLIRMSCYQNMPACYDEVLSFKNNTVSFWNMFKTKMHLSIRYYGDENYKKA